MRALGTALSLTIFALMVLPPGYAALRLAGTSARGLAGLAGAFGAGWALVLPVVLLERWAHVPFLAVPLALGSLAWLRPGRAALREARAMGPDLALPLALGALFHAVNAPDFARGPDGASFRLGFDVADRLGYGVIAEELLRAPPHRMENPLFAPVPIQYSLFPALAGHLVRTHTGADLVTAFLWQLPAIGVVFLGIGVAGLLAEWGVGRGARMVTVGLTALGGDLSFLTRTADVTGLERARHFFAFHSFAAEALLYNPWVWAVPVTLVALVLSGRWLAAGRPRDLALAGLVLGALWQTKVFAFLSLMAGAVLAALLLRRARLLALVAAGIAGAAPWLLLTAASAGGRSGWPLQPDLLRPVRRSLELNETLRWAAGLLGDAPPAVLIAATLLFLAGAFGVRLLGLTALVRSARSDAAGLHALVASTILAAVTASLVLRGHPYAIDGVQFLMLALYLSWLYAGPVVARAGGGRAWVALAIAAVAMVSPLLAIARKVAPERLTAPHALDRVRVTLRPDTVRACEWLRTHSAPGDRVVLPLSGDPEDVGGTKPLLVAALSARRVSAYTVAVHVSETQVTERQGWVERLYETEDEAEVESLLDRLGAQWVWDDARRPLRARPPGWSVHEVAPGLRLIARPRR